MTEAVVSALPALLRTRREDIVQRFADALYEAGASIALDREKLIDSAREFLTDLAECLDRKLHRGRVVTAGSASAATHGRQRFGLGYDIGTMVREYIALRDVLHDMMLEAGQPLYTAEDVHGLSRCLLGAVADAATQYSAAKDAAFEEQTARHLGFLAHELRNPVSSAKLSASLMRQREAAPSPLLRTIERSLARLGELIDNALVQVRFKSLRALHKEKVDLGLLLHDLAEDCAADLEGKGISLHAEVPPGLWVWADRKILSAAVSNLIRNAIKFTRDRGRVFVRAAGTEGQVMIQVEDQCGGLPPGDPTRLFDPFVQAGRNRTGFGLGLAIAKQAAEAHEGALRLKDLPGRGCVFALVLPEERP